MTDVWVSEMERERQETIYVETQEEMEMGDTGSTKIALMDGAKLRCRITFELLD